ncbi:hypothetical protein ABT236_20740 [Streptomyces sp. NPDC001523]|uniref:hypothetical protein n=1 Tax=Streptomyces sp. NPDC001523 TaxID=3154383 RepID=UPI003325B4EE
MSLAGQLLPLVGVALGAVTSFLAVSLNERTKWRRQQSIRWDERRMTAYAEYIHAVKELAARYQRVAAAHGLVTGPAPLELTSEVLEELAEWEARRSALSATCGLVGDTRTNTASKSLNHCLWRLELLCTKSRRTIKVMVRRSGRDRRRREESRDGESSVPAFALHLWNW